MLFREDCVINFSAVVAERKPSHRTLIFAFLLSLNAVPVHHHRLTFHISVKSGTRGGKKEDFRARLLSQSLCDASQQLIISIRLGARVSRAEKKKKFLHCNRVNHNTVARTRTGSCRHSFFRDASFSSCFHPLASR